MENRNVIPGLLVRSTSHRGFKLAVILNWSDRSPDKVRVCVWRANSRAWTKPQAYDADALEILNQEDLSGRRGAVVRGALASLLKHKRVDWPGGSWPFGNPTTDPPVWTVEAERHG